MREKRGEKQLKLTAKPIPMLSLTQIASIGYNIHKLASHDLALISMKYCPLDKETEVAMGRSYYQLDLLKMHNCTLVEAREEVRGMLEKEGRVYE